MMDISYDGWMDGKSGRKLEHSITHHESGFFVESLSVLQCGMEGWKLVGAAEAVVQRYYC